MLGGITSYLLAGALTEIARSRYMLGGITSYLLSGLHPVRILGVPPRIAVGVGHVFHVTSRCGEAPEEFLNVLYGVLSVGALLFAFRRHP